MLDDDGYFDTDVAANYDESAADLFRPTSWTRRSAY